MILLNRDEIQRYVHFSWRPETEIEVFQTIPSTNDYLRTTLSSVHKRFRICLAEGQTQGKGRLQRSWHSPFGQNIYFSCLYRFSKDCSELAGLSLVVSLAVIKMMEDSGMHQGLTIKWPNDVRWNDRKLSGILIELMAESHGSSSAIIGIGINVNMDQASSSLINQPWVSLKQVVGQELNRNELIGHLMNHLFSDILQFEQQGFVPFISEWEKYDALLGQDIAVISGSETISGRMMGINERGNLLLKEDNGQIFSCSAGDVSIKL